MGHLFRVYPGQPNGSADDSTAYGITMLSFGQGHGKLVKSEHRMPSVFSKWQIGPQAVQKME